MHSGNPDPYREKWVRGDPHNICDRCGMEMRKSRAIKEWTGSIVCKQCFEPKHPQLSIKTRPDTIAYPDARPGANDVLLDSSSPSISDYSDLTQTTDLSISNPVTADDF